MDVNKSAFTQKQDCRNGGNTSNESSSDENEFIIGDASSEEENLDIKECQGGTSFKYDIIEDASSEERENHLDVEGQDPPEILPSKVLDKEYIYMPQSFENFEEREEWKFSGKWLLYVHGQQEKLDHLWINLQPLLADGTLICLKSSTATDTTKGILMCYTYDCKDRESVKKAANAIRNVLPDQEIIYYKTNEASDCGLYNEKGDKCIAKYMNSVAGSLYERDEYNRWKKIFFDSDEMNKQLENKQV